MSMYFLNEHDISTCSNDKVQTENKKNMASGVNEHKRKYIDIKEILKIMGISQECEEFRLLPEWSTGRENKRVELLIQWRWKIS